MTKIVEELTMIEFFTIQHKETQDLCMTSSALILKPRSRLPLPSSEKHENKIWKNKTNKISITKTFKDLTMIEIQTKNN